MGRRAKPFPHEGWWKTNMGGYRTRLCPLTEPFSEAERKLAQLRLDQAALQQANSSVVFNPQNRQTLAHVHDLFLDFKLVETSQSTYEINLTDLKPLFAMFGERLIDTLSEADGLTYKTWLQKDRTFKRGKHLVTQKPSNCDVNHKLKAARALFAFAEKRGFIPKHPWRSIKALAERGRERLVTEQEFQAILNEEQCPHNRDCWTVLKFTTLRPGELRHLLWEYVNFNLHQVIYPASIIKTRNRRVVTLLPVVEDVLRNRLANRKTAKCPWVFPGPGGLVEMSKDLLVQRWSRVRDRCVQKGLITDLKDGEKLVCYSSRHTAITNLIKANVPLITVSKEAGHKNTLMTQRYVHLSEQEVTQAVRDAGIGALASNTHSPLKSLVDSQNP